MKRSIYGAVIALTIILTALPALATRTIWTGRVSSDGNRVVAVGLQAGATYIMEVSGSVYFGRWSQNGRDLLQDACYEFNARGYPVPLPVFKNSANINVCQSYRADHVYRSAPFVADGQPLLLWIFDTDYRDNNGALSVRILKLDGGSPPPSPGPGPVTGAVQLFNHVPTQPSDNFKHNRFPAVRVETQRWDRTPYHLTRSFTSRIRIAPGEKIILAGDRRGERPIFIDNFLLFELHSAQGTNIFFVGLAEPITYNGRPVRRVGSDGARQLLDLTPEFPVGTDVEVTVYALDYGGVGGVSDVFLVGR